MNAVERLATEALSIGYTRGHALARDVGLSAHAGELVSVVGPNGAGKSTLLRVLAGLQDPLCGSVRIDDGEVHRLEASERARLIGVDLPHHESPPHLRVKELVALGRYPHTSWFGGLSRRDRDLVEEAMQATGIEPFAERELSHLSDGEAQKAHIARGIAQQAPVLILDEPTAYLDVTSRLEITHLLRDIAHRERRLVLFSTHDLAIALETADRMWLFLPAEPETAGGGPAGPAAGGVTRAAGATPARAPAAADTPSAARIAEGAPEDLALEGKLREAFSRHGVDFREDGTPVVRGATEAAARVELEGPDGPALRWTRRALARAGFLPSGAEPRSEVRREEPRTAAPATSHRNAGRVAGGDAGPGRQGVQVFRVTLEDVGGETGGETSAPNRRWWLERVGPGHASGGELHAQTRSIGGLIAALRAAAREAGDGTRQE